MLNSLHTNQIRQNNRFFNSRKDPYCIRRRNFNPEAAKPRNPKPTVDRPCVNPAIKSYLQRLQNKQRNHSEDSFSSSSGTDSDYVPNLDHIGAQEYVVTTNAGDPNSPADPYEFDYHSPDPEEPRVRVEYNFECDYDFTPNCWTSAKLPIHSQGPQGALPHHQFSPNNSQAFMLGSVGMSPPSSEDATGNQLELRIPTPDYLRHIGGSQNPLLQSPTSYPMLAKMWENLNTSGSSGVGMPADKPHPWQDPSLNAETQS